jgi:UDP-glucose 4-epimerase
VEDDVGEVFNIGNDQEITIGALASKVKAMTGSASEIVTVPYDVAYEAGFEDMTRRVPDLSKIRRVIGYEPQLSLDEIIAEVVEFMRERRPVA